MSPSIVQKTAAWKAAGVAAVLALAMPYPLHAAPVNGGDTVQALYDALISTMKNGRTLGQNGRFTQGEQVMESFGRYISAIYADRFDSYAGQKLQVTGEQPNATGVMVRSQIVKANGEPGNVDYMMR